MRFLDTKKTVVSYRLPAQARHSFQHAMNYVESAVMSGTNRAVNCHDPDLEATMSDLPANRRPVGRPRGTGYAKQDAPLHEQMRHLLASGQVHSRTGAARKLAEMAYGHGCLESKTRRLVRSFPR